MVLRSSGLGFRVQGCGDPTGTASSSDCLGFQMFGGVGGVALWIHEAGLGEEGPGAEKCSCLSLGQRKSCTA